jgi:hypothetical protein
MERNAHPHHLSQEQENRVGSSPTTLPHQENNVLQFSTLSSPSIYFRASELFEELKIKIFPIRLGPYSKVPLDAGWTSEDYDPNLIAWPRHPGNIGIIPGRSSLVVIDCDTEESIQFFTELANKINLSLDTLIVKTRRGQHYYFYCSFSSALEKKQFTDASKNIKIDILAGNKCQVVAPYSQLKLDPEGNVLKYDAKEFKLFTYEPIHIPEEKLVEITPELYNLLINELEKSLQKTKEKQTVVEKTTQDEKQEGRELTDEEIKKIAEIVEPFFVEGQRQNLLLYLAGYLRKDLNISEESVYKLYELLYPIDDPKDKRYRFEAIRRSFLKNLNDIAGKSKLDEKLGKDTTDELVNKIKQALGIQPQKTKKKKSKKKKKKSDEELLEQLYKEIEQNQQNAHRNYVLIEINRKAKKFARCNFIESAIEYGAFEENEDTGMYHYVVHQKVLDFCIQKIYITKNILTNEKKYEIHIVSNNKADPHNVFTGDLEEIWEAIKKKPYVLQPGLGLQILTIVLSHYLARGWFEEKIEDLPPGFYHFDKLIASKFEEKPYSQEELRKAALFLNDYIMSHPNAQLISSIIKAGLLLPFSFAQKQLVHLGKLRQRMRYLFLYGETKTGKTTTATLLASIWRQVNKISYASFNSEARAGKHLSASTHILIVDEVSKDLETSTVKEILKYAQEDLIARSIQSKNLKQVHYPALAGVIMTSNTHFPADPALLERFFVFNFRKSDKIAHDKRQRYEREDFRVLEPLGQFAWNYIKTHGLKDDYINYAVEILKAFYKSAEVEAEWLDWDFTHDTAETEEEQQYTKEAEFYNAVIKFFNQNVKPQEGLSFAKSVYHSLKEMKFGRWIWVDDKNMVYISKDFLIELKKFHRCEIRDLEELSSLTGWERKKKLFEYSIIWVVATGVEDFFFRLNYIPQLLSSTEFKQWLAGELEVKHYEDEAEQSQTH